MTRATKAFLILTGLALLVSAPVDAFAAPEKKSAAAKKALPAKKTASAKAPAKKSSASRKRAAAATPNKPVPVPRPRPGAAPKLVAAAASQQATKATEVSAQTIAPVFATASLAPTAPKPVTAPASPGASSSGLQIPENDFIALKKALDLVRRGKQDEAETLQKGIGDPAARKLIEWSILRSDNNSASFARYVNFVEGNPGWPTVRTFRRRAEHQLWQEKRDPATVRAFFAQTKPMTPRGRFALARALLAQGDRTAAAYYVREAWRTDPFSADLEADAMATFGDLVTRADHKARMDRMLYVDEAEVALRAAKRLGERELAIYKARNAVTNKASNAAALLEAAPKEARSDAGYTFSRIQHLRRGDKIAEAAQVMLGASRDPNVIQDADEWWVERRLLARKLLDVGDPHTAYLVARDAAAPVKENYRAEHEFTAGWIAFRFLNNPKAALAHFARVGRGTSNPITLARAAYWQGRAAEALGRQAEARAHYEAGARFPTAYYGQLARAKLGIAEIGLRRPVALDGPHLAAVRNLDIVRAVEMLYASANRDLIPAIVADMADRVTDVAALVAIAQICERHQDARSVLLIGKYVLARGVAFDHFAFPTIGVPAYSAIGPSVERSIVFAIARQESHFNQRTVSTAKALGLMQVTPPAGRYVAKKFGVSFDQKRLLSDPVYNTQMGAAELGDLLKDYRGSYVLSFAAYNAGRGRVRDWVQRFGDPRDPAVDPVDWVERIPFSETRNYVQRVMENMQVYRARFGSTKELLIEADMRRGATGL